MGRNMHKIKNTWQKVNTIINNYFKPSRAIEDWLATSSDQAELEHRIKMLKNKGIL